MSESLYCTYSSTIGNYHPDDYRYSNYHPDIPDYPDPADNSDLTDQFGNSGSAVALGAL